MQNKHINKNEGGMHHPRLLNRNSKMNNLTMSHDTHLFSRMRDILVMSGTGKSDYGISISDYGTLASVMNQTGLTNKWGNPLNASSLKQLVHRMRVSGDVEEYTPDWNVFSHTPHDNPESSTQPSEDTHDCLVCGTPMKSRKRKLCSTECIEFYQEYKDTPCDFTRFPTVFHQMRYEESSSENIH